MNRGLKMVTVYTLPHCVQCETTKKMLEKNNVDFNTVDLSQDESAYAMVKSLGYSSAPVVIAGEDHWSGFRIEKIKSLTNNAVA
jgi:glutaredoxin-like protein NrdH